MFSNVLISSGSGNAAKAHATGLLKKEQKAKRTIIPEEDFYYIKVDNQGARSLACLTEIEKRIHDNYNYQEHYFYNHIFKDALPRTNIEAQFSTFANTHLVHEIE